MKTRLDRLARSTRDLLNTLAQIAEKDAGFRFLADAWADSKTAQGRSNVVFRPKIDWTSLGKRALLTKTG